LTTVVGKFSSTTKAAAAEVDALREIYEDNKDECDDDGGDIDAEMGGGENENEVENAQLGAFERSVLCMVCRRTFFKPSIV